MPWARTTEGHVAGGAYAAVVAQAPQDPFTDVLGRRRGTSEGEPDPVLLVYRTLSRRELAACAAMRGSSARLSQSQGGQRESALLSAARIERRILERLPDGTFLWLASAFESMVGELWDDEERARLCARLRACFQARVERAAALLEQAGAKPMGMHSVEGDIAVCRLLGSLEGMGREEAEGALSAGLRRLASSHPEVYDTVVSEEAHEGLEHMLAAQDTSPSLA
jgi:hypothetical protein